jgi:hypothetical protein
VRAVLVCSVDAYHMSTLHLPQTVYICTLPDNARPIPLAETPWHQPQQQRLWPFTARRMCHLSAPSHVTDVWACSTIIPSLDPSFFIESVVCAAASGWRSILLRRHPSPRTRLRSVLLHELRGHLYSLLAMECMLHALLLLPFDFEAYLHTRFLPLLFPER